jgi:hypothetical protein
MSAVSAVPAKRVLDIRRPSVNGLLVSVLAIPLLWVLGLSLITWVLLAFCLALGLSVRHDWLADRSFGWWLAFIVCVAASSVAVPDTARFEAYLYRLVMYVAAAVFFIYGYTRVRNGAPVAKITQILVIYWGMIVVGGFLGLLLPGVTINSVAAHYAPDSLSNNEFVSVFLHPRFAQVQDFRNLGFPRPATLFGYTNGWGSAYAILTDAAPGDVGCTGIVDHPGRALGEPRSLAQPRRRHPVRCAPSHPPVGRAGGPCGDRHLSAGGDRLRVHAAG